MAQLKKSDLIKILVEEYGYEKEDLKFDAEGKPYTNAKLQAIIKSEEKDAKDAELENTRVVVKDNSGLKENDLVYVMNGLTDTLVYHSQRSNRRYELSRFGEQDTMEYAELKAMRNRYPRYFTEGWLIVLDEQVQKEFKLEEMYQNILTPENIDLVFELSVEELEKFVDALPEGQKLAFVNKAQELFERDELINFKIIKLIENKFNFRFEDNAPLDDVIDTKEKSGSANIIIVERK